MAFELTSSAFKEGARIPDRHTCEGDDLSPPLHWGVPPAATKSFALIADDPDAPGGTWVHWVIYNLSLDLRGLPEGIPAKDHWLEGALQGLTRFQAGRLWRALSPAGEAASVLFHALCAGCRPHSEAPRNQEPGAGGL